MRLIDADKLEANGYALHRIYQKDAHTMVSETIGIDTIPTIDAVPVVRCRECKNWFGPDDGDDGKEHSCSVDAWMRPGNWFCPLGHRREDGDNT